MAFLEGFIEDDSPTVPARPPAPTAQAAAPAPAAPSPAGKRRPGACSPTPMLDLTASPPPMSPPPSKRARIDSTQALDNWFGEDEQPSVASSSKGGSSGLAGTRKVLHVGLPAAQGSTGSSASVGGIASTARGSSSSTFAATPSTSALSGNNGFARYSQPVASPQGTFGAPGHQQQQQRATSFSSTSFVPPSASPQFSLGRIPVISSASAARVPSARLGSGSSNAGAPPSPSTSRAPSGSGSNQPKNYYRMQSTAVSASMNALAKSGIIPAPPGQRSASMSSAGTGPSRSNSLAGAGGGGRGRKASGDMIDLTADDGTRDSDDDIIVDDTPVCIGLVTSLALILYPVVELLPPVPTSPGGTPLPNAPPPPPSSLTPLPIHILRADPQGSNETLKLVTPGRRETFGVMEHRVANVVASLFGDGWTGTGVGAPLGRGGKVWCEASVVRRGERNPMMLPLRLLLFTHPANVEAVGAHLEAATIYLEHPVSYNPGLHNNATYRNPHNPIVGGGVRPGGPMGRRPLGDNSGYGMRRPYNGGSNMESATEIQRRDVEQVFHSLKSGPDLDEVVPPPVVTTSLYPHQKQALSFLIDRETAIKIPERDDPAEPTMVSLWQRCSDTYGRPVGWRSLVTGDEIKGVEAPPQARGAILADDMGLGKTIVIISLVATTLPIAREWASSSLGKETLDPRFEVLRSTAKTKTTISLNDFSSNLYGLAGSPATIAAPPLVPGGPILGANGRPLSKKALAKRKREEKREGAQETRYSKLVTRSRATLIVCPLSTVQNWESQFEEHTARKGDVAGKGRKWEVLDEEGNVVEVSMDVGGEDKVKAEETSRRIRTSSGKGKGKAKGKGKGKASGEEDDDSFGDDSGSDDDSDASTSSTSTSGKRALSIYVYHGNSRIMDPLKLANHDVVITTFSTLGTEFSKQQRAEDEREEEEAARLKAEQGGSDEEPIEVFGFDEDGGIIETQPGEVVPAGKPLKKKKVPKRPRKKVEGSGVSPLQQIQWFRVVLDEAHIIKEHTTIQARAACELSALRRIALSGTPLQNSLNDLFSLVRFIRLEPFTERPVWTQHIGALVKSGSQLGVERLQLIMRHLTLRRTKESVDKNGKPILSLPPVSHKVIKLKLDPAEHAFYASHHQRYQHAFMKLEETDSVMKNFCSILQEILRLRQICVHMALVKDAEDVDGDLIQSIEKHGISKPRAIQLLALMKDAGGAQCVECGVDMLAGVSGAGGEADEDVKPEVGKRKAPAKRKRPAASTSASASAANSEDDHAGTGATPPPAGQLYSVVTRCQHLFCRACFAGHVYPGWPNKVVSTDRATCTVCRVDMTPALDAVEIGADEFERALEEDKDEGGAGDEDEKPKRGKGKAVVKKEKKGKATRFFEHSTKTRALIDDLLPFSRANPASSNYWGGMDLEEPLTEETGGTIGFQPVKGEVVKSVVFSQWTKLLDRLGDALENENIGFHRLDGGMNRDQRTRAMDAFKSDPHCEVLLVSLRAGGVGLNLTAGRRVYLMEPFWNPAVENQAVDRVYRLGQTMPVQTVRFVMTQSIEEKMLEIQKKKMDLANASLKQTKSKAELAKERVQELKHLFSV